MIETRLLQFLVENRGQPAGGFTLRGGSQAFQTFTSPRTTEVTRAGLYLGLEGKVSAPLHVSFYTVSEDGEGLGEKMLDTRYDPLLHRETGWCDIPVVPGVAVKRNAKYAILLSAPECEEGGYVWCRSDTPRTPDSRTFTRESETSDWRAQDYGFLFRLSGPIDVASIVILPTVKGYVFVEARNKEAVATAIQGMRHMKNRPLITVPFDDIGSHLVEKPLIDIISTGDIVEIVSGPLRGIVGTVIRIEKPKREVTLELSDAAFPLPISVTIDAVRITKKSTNSA